MSSSTEVIGSIMDWFMIFVATMVGAMSSLIIVYSLSAIANKLGISAFTKKPAKVDQVRDFPPMRDDAAGLDMCPSSHRIIPSDLRGLARATFAQKPEISPLEAAVQAYQEENKCRLILINQKLSSGGSILPLFETSSSVGLEEASALVEILGGIPVDTSLHIILRSCGGTLQAAEIITHALRNHKGEICIFVSQYAQSAATIIALNATHLFMNANAFLTPTDPQIMGFSARTITKMAERAAQIGGVVGLLVSLAQETAQGAIARSNSVLLDVPVVKDSASESAVDLRARLMGYSGHDQPIFATELAKMLGSITIGIPGSIQNIIKLDNEQQHRGRYGL